MKHKVLIFVPAYEKITITTFMSIIGLQAMCAKYQIGAAISAASFAFIEELRNIMLTAFYDSTDATHLFFVDSDMGFPPELLLDQILADVPVVGTMYPQRQVPQTWAGSFFENVDRFERRGNFMKVEGVGMGCTLIRRDAVTRMLEKFPDLSDPTPLDLHPAREVLESMTIKRIIRAFDPIELPGRGKVRDDLAFCLRWRECGGEVWAAMGHHISHIGAYDFGARYLDLVEAAEKTESQAA